MFLAIIIYAGQWISQRINLSKYTKFWGLLVQCCHIIRAISACNYSLRVSGTWGRIRYLVWQVFAERQDGGEGDIADFIFIRNWARPTKRGFRNLVSNTAVQGHPTPTIAMPLVGSRLTFLIPSDAQSHLMCECARLRHEANDLQL